MSLRTPLSSDFANLTKDIGVYALCDLDGFPVYVGQTVSVPERGIVGRVRRHLTSARSDIIANLQLDVWELAFVRAWAVVNKADVTELEICVHNAYKNTILAGRILGDRPAAPLPSYQQVKILEDAEVKRRKNPRLRYPRQLRHIDHLLDVILNRKDSPDQRRSLHAHMLRLQKRYEDFVTFAVPDEDTGDADV